MIPSSLLSTTNGSKYLAIENIEEIIGILTPLLETPPLSALDQNVYNNKHDQPDNFIFPEYLKNIFNGMLRSRPVNVIDIFSFNGELDLLETRLIELDHAVDHFVIVESTRTHRGAKKPLFFERNKHRYQRFLSKIVYLIFDDNDFPHIDGRLTESDVWERERFQRKACWDRANSKIGRHLNSDDIVIHGDLDEIPSGESIYVLKHFEPYEALRNCGIAFHCKTLQWLFQSDHPVSQDQPYTLSFPNLFSVEELNHGIDVRQELKNGGIFLPAGTHLTYYAYIPYLAYKTISLAEGGKLETILQRLKAKEDILKIESSLLDDPQYFELWAGRFKKNDALTNTKEPQNNMLGTLHIPKIVESSPARLPLLLGKPDPRHKLFGYD